MTNQDNLINVTVFLGDNKAPIVLTTDRIPSVGDFLDIAEEGSYMVIRIEHLIVPSCCRSSDLQADTEQRKHILRKTRVVCEQVELPVV